ncbi:MAG: OmpA family protein [Kiritimatiellia bacterium]
MKKMKLLTVLNIVLLSTLVFMQAGCSGKNKGTENDPLFLDNEGGAMIEGSVVDESGYSVPGGASFRDTCEEVQGVSFEPAYFAFDSYALAPNEIAKVDAVGRHLLSNGNHVLIVEGHCDERGSEEYNLALGENRALSVRSYLVNMGIAADRIQTVSFGEEKPAVMGTGESAWSMNRRCEFALFRK